MSLLEVLTATTLTATLMASSTVVLRSSYAAWQAHEADLERAESAHAVLRHVVRHLRQADAVLSGLTAGGETTPSGTLSLRMPSGDDYVWEHNAGTGEVLFGVGSATSLLADNIDSLAFTALMSDGQTAADNAGDAQVVRCQAEVTMPSGGGTSRTVTCSGWIRSW